MNQPQETYPSPYGPLLISAAAAYGMFITWPLGQEGNDIACIGAVILFFVMLKNFFVGLLNWDERAAQLKIYKRSMIPTGGQGSAEFACLKDTKAANMHNSNGIFLGSYKNKDLYFSGEGSILALAPPGAGKTTCLAAQHLLRSPHSTVVFDPKLELWATTHKAREEMGHLVQVISPWHKAFEEQFKGSLKTHDDGFDPCSFLDPNSEDLIDDCVLLASLLLPVSGKETDNSKYFRDFSKAILEAFMLLELSNSGKITLPKLRSMIMAPQSQFENSVAEMLRSSAYDGVLAEYGARIAAPMVNAPKEFQGGWSGAMQALKVYDSFSPLGKHVERAGVDFRKFKDQPTTIYIAQPSDKVQTHSSWSSMMITLAMEMIAKDRRKKKSIFLVDEFQNIGVVLPILKGIAIYRGTGIQFLLLVQFLAALKRLYGESYREFLSVDLITSFGAPGDIETLELLSKLTGMQSAQDISFTSNSESEKVGLASKEYGRPLLRPDEIRLLPADKQLIIARNLPPLIADKQSYLNNRKLRKKASPNPYYRKDK